MAGEAEYRQLGRGIKRKDIRGGGPDWTDLPELAIDQILDMLDSHKDYLRFLLVCKTWRYYALRLWPYKKSNYVRFLGPHPVLLVGDHVYSPGTGKMLAVTSAGCRFKWPSTRSHYPGFSVIGSSFGWLVTHSPLINGVFVVVLANPRASRYLNHRYRFSPPGRNLLDGFHPSKAVLSADPSSSTSYSLAILFRKPSSVALPRLLFFRHLHPGTGDAYCRLYRTRDRVLDIAHHGNNIGILQKGTPRSVNAEPEGLVIATVSGTGDVIRKAKITYVWDEIPFERKPLPPSIDHHSSSVYLVERLPGSGGCCSVGYNHWLVMRHRIIREFEGGVRTIGFGVFEWAHSKKDQQGSMLWRRVHDLKNEAIFLGRNSAFSIPAGSGLLAAGGRLQPNYIYFFDDQQLNTERKNLAMAPDIGAFDVVQGCRKPFRFPREFNHLLDYDVMKNHGPPLWFTAAPLV